MRFIVYPYKIGSKSGKLIASCLDALRVYADRDYRPKPGDFIINWGSGYTPVWKNFVDEEVTLLNHWDNVNFSINKLETFARLKKAGVRTPEWSLHSARGVKWAEEGNWVCCRQVVEGKDGEGLVLAKSPNAVVGAKLYTKYVPILQEFRAYVVGGKMIDLMEKRRDSDLLKEGKVNQDVRTESNGWVFCHYGFNPPAGIDHQAVESIKALGLDFGGVDIILGKDRKLYTLETNTASGVGEKSAMRFAEAFKKLAAA